MGAGGSVLKKAQRQEHECDALFNKHDLNSDGKLSYDEIRTALHEIKNRAAWTDKKIADTIKRFDVDGDGLLDKVEFTLVLHELKQGVLLPGMKSTTTALNSPGNWKFFISHKQSETATEGVMLMSEWGKDACWLDRNMKDKSEAAMQEGVEESETFVCILSEGYFQSAYCCKELTWAFAADKHVVSTYKAGLNVGAILNKAPEELRERICKVDSIKLDSSDPDYFAVGLKKIKDCLDAHATCEKRKDEEAWKLKKKAAEAAKLSGKGGGGGGGKGATFVGSDAVEGDAAEAKAVITIFDRGDGKYAAELKKLMCSHGALADNVTISDIENDPIANDGMWVMAKAAGLANSVSLPLVAVGGPLVGGPHKVFCCPRSPSEMEELKASLAGDGGMAALAAKKEAKAKAHEANKARRAGDLKDGKVDVKLIYTGSKEEMASEGSRVGEVVGIYARVGSATNGRYVYETKDKTKLYYVESHRLWFIGPTPGQPSGFANAESEAEAPDLIESAFEVVARGGGWKPCEKISVVRVNAKEEGERARKEKLEERRKRGVVVWGRLQCPLSNAFEQLLKSHGVSYMQINVDECDAYWAMEAGFVKEADPPPKGSLLPTIDAGGKGFYGKSPWPHSDMMEALEAARTAAAAAGE